MNHLYDGWLLLTEQFDFDDVCDWETDDSSIFHTKSHKINEERYAIIKKSAIVGFTEEQLIQHALNTDYFYVDVNGTVDGLRAIGITRDLDDPGELFCVMLVLDFDLNSLGEFRLYRLSLSKNEMVQIIHTIWDTKELPDISEESEWQLL